MCQPLDCSLFKPLKEQWRHKCHRFYQRNPGLVISKFNFCSIFCGAWLNAILPTNVIAGFKKSGVYPFNRDAVLKSTDNLSNISKANNWYAKKSLNFFYNVVHFLVGDKTSLDESSTVTSVNQVPETVVSSDQPTFTLEQEQRYQRRYEEGFDLPDKRYEVWLKIDCPGHTTTGNISTQL